MTDSSPHTCTVSGSSKAGPGERLSVMQADGSKGAGAVVVCLWVLKQGPKTAAYMLGYKARKGMDGGTQTFTFKGRIMNVSSLHFPCEMISLYC